MVKKYMVIAGKFLIGLFPVFIREKIKRWPWLTSLYSRTLQKHGLSYGVQSKKRAARYYDNFLSYQDGILGAIEVGSNVNVVIIVNEKISLLDMTLSNLSTLDAINAVYLITDNQEGFSELSAKFSSNFKIIVKTSFEFFVDTEYEIKSVLLINAGDTLNPLIANAISHFENLNSTIGYFDSDLITSAGKKHSPKFHADWDPDLLLSTGYLNTGVWFRTNSVFSKKVKLLIGKTAIADMLVNAYFTDSDIVIDHLPFVMIHSKIDFSKVNPPLSSDAMDTISEYAEIRRHKELPILKLLWKVDEAPLVSLIIPTKNSHVLVKACIDSILNKTTFSNYEILLIDNQSDEKASLEYFNELSKHPKIRVLKYNEKFNYSAINNFAVDNAHGEIVGLINNDIEVIEPDWLSFMVAQVSRDEIGCVGAKLLYPDGRVQHAGVVLGYGGGAGHAHKYFFDGHGGYLNRLAATNRFSAVTAACLLVKKKDYLAVNGLDEVNLEIAFNDVDFCLKVLSLGRKNIYCAEAVLYHHESVSRGFDDTTEKRKRFEKELAYLQRQWASYIARDPAYSPNLTLRRENFSIKEY